MGLDLALLPVDYEDEYHMSSHSILKLERRRNIWGDIASLPSSPAGDVTGYMGDEFCTRRKDPYGNDMRWVYAQDLAALKDHTSVQDDDRNQAIWTFLAALKPESKVILYWY